MFVSDELSKKCCTLIMGARDIDEVGVDKYLKEFSKDRILTMEMIKNNYLEVFCIKFSFK